MKKWIVPVSLLVIIAICIAGYFGFAGAKTRGAAQKELAAQQSEKQQCTQRLAQMYKAWERYRKDHKGAEPPSVNALVPAYLSDPSLLICPTALRWINQRKSVNQGSIQVGDKSYGVTYGFQWLTAGAARSVKKLGDKLPLITCDAHEEGLYRAVFEKAVPLGAFDPEARSHYISELQNAKILAVRRNGEVEELTPEAP